MTTMLYYGQGEMDFFGETRGYDVDFELDDGVPIIHMVSITMQVCKAGGIWYDCHGRHHSGPKYISKDITDLLSAKQIGMIAEEINNHYAGLREEDKAADASDRAMDRYLHFRANGEYPRQYPENFVGHGG